MIRCKICYNLEPEGNFKDLKKGVCNLCERKEKRKQDNDKVEKMVKKPLIDLQNLNPDKEKLLLKQKLNEVVSASLNDCMAYDGASYYLKPIQTWPSGADLMFDEILFDGEGNVKSFKFTSKNKMEILRALAEKYNVIESPNKSGTNVQINNNTVSENLEARLTKANIRSQIVETLIDTEDKKK